MILKFIENQHSAYYKSDLFGGILKAATRAESKFIFRQNNNKLSVVVRSIKDISAATAALQELAERPRGSPRYPSRGKAGLARQNGVESCKDESCHRHRQHLAKLAVIENGQVVDFLKTDRSDVDLRADVLDANLADLRGDPISCRTTEAPSRACSDDGCAVSFASIRVYPSRSKRLCDSRYARTGPARRRRGAWLRSIRVTTC